MRCYPSLKEFLSYFINPVKRFFPIFLRFSGIILPPHLPWVAPQMPLYVRDAPIHDFPKRHVAPSIDILQTPPGNATGPRPDDASRIIATMKQPTKHTLHSIDRTR